MSLDPYGHQETITWKPAPPVTEAELLEAEAKLGFPLPPLLRRFYREVSNGWFGPGQSGLWQLDGPWPVDSTDDEHISLVALYREEHPEPPDVCLPESLF